jgi:Protein of unknown function (DUF3826)
MIHMKYCAADRSSGFKTCAGFMRITLHLFLFILLVDHSTIAQSASDTAYVRVLTDRSAKIVGTLGLKDPATAESLTRLLVDQYIAVNDIHARYKPLAKPASTDTASVLQWEASKQQMAAQKATELNARHTTFIKAISEQLPSEAVEAVKDGMTYRVMPITYAAYLDMLPGLTTEQRGRIMEWLREARELAMDEGSSNAKHAVFGKYKGRINNYLSAQGYDLKKETEAWQQRIKQRNTTK